MSVNANLKSCALVLAVLAYDVGAAQSQVCGDVNSTQSVTTSDALSVLRVAVGQEVELLCEGDCETISPRVAILEDSLALAQAQVATLSGQLDGTIEAILTLQQMLTGVSRDAETLVFSGVNLQLLNGAGETGGTGNGLGNLILGYNEGTLEQERTGSHNLIVGSEHEYTSSGGIVAGEMNTISAVGASVLGGFGNVASGANSSVCGGKDNRAQGLFSVAVAGLSNSANGLYATVSGGCDNDATNTFSTVNGGQGGLASGELATVNGGFGNTASGTYATLGGGKSREAAGQYNWRAGLLLEDQ